MPSLLYIRMYSGLRDKLSGLLSTIRPRKGGLGTTTVYPHPARLAAVLMEVCFAEDPSAIRREWRIPHKGVSPLYTGCIAQHTDVSLPHPPSPIPRGRLGSGSQALQDGQKGGWTGRLRCFVSRQGFCFRGDAGATIRAPGAAAGPRNRLAQTARTCSGWGNAVSTWTTSPPSGMPSSSSSCCSTMLYGVQWARGSTASSRHAQPSHGRGSDRRSLQGRGGLGWLWQSTASASASSHEGRNKPPDGMRPATRCRARLTPTVRTRAHFDFGLGRRTVNSPEAPSSVVCLKVTAGTVPKLGSAVSVAAHAATRPGPWPQLLLYLSPIPSRGRLYTVVARLSL